MMAAIVAVAGTLLGSLLTFLAGDRRAHTALRAAAHHALHH